MWLLFGRTHTLAHTVFWNIDLEFNVFPSQRLLLRKIKYTNKLNWPNGCCYYRQKIIEKKWCEATTLKAVLRFCQVWWYQSALYISKITFYKIGFNVLFLGYFCLLPWLIFTRNKINIHQSFTHSLRFGWPFKRRQDKQLTAFIKPSDHFSLAAFSSSILDPLFRFACQRFWRQISNALNFI